MKTKKLLCITILQAFSFSGVLNAVFFMEKKSPEKSSIIFNDEEIEVYFTDGDTFRTKTGNHKDERVRVGGYNALESYGPIHQWALFSEKELYQNAKEATKFARDGRWHCQSDLKRDTYGRLLAICDDLAIGLIENGLAHAYSIDNNPADKKYIKAQEKSQQEKLGMWKKGVPEFIITSLHSADENSVSKNIAADTYNRMISTIDGRSKKWQHNDVYETCQKICVDGSSSCMIFVPFKERYGRDRAICLKN